MERIAVSISHEREYAVAIAFGIRTAGGAFVFPLDIEARLDDREQAILARMERLRTLHEEAVAAERRLGAAGASAAARDGEDPDDALTSRERRARRTRRRRRRRSMRRRGVARPAPRPRRPQGHVRARRGRRGLARLRRVRRSSRDAPRSAVVRASRRCFVPASLQPLIAGRVPELITRGLPEVAAGRGRPGRGGRDRSLDEPHDALVIGPGLVPDRATARLVEPAPGGGRRAGRGRRRRARRARDRARLVADARAAPAS